MRKATRALALTLVGILAAVAVLLPSAASATGDLSNSTLPLEQRQVQEFTPFEPEHPGKVWYTYRVDGVQQSLYAPPAMMYSNTGMCYDSNYKCLVGANHLTVNGFFGYCAAGDPAPCIDGIEGRSSKDSEWVKGEFSSEISFVPNQTELQDWANQMSQDIWGGVITDLGDGKGWSSDATVGNYPSAGGPLKFRIPGVLNAGGSDQYLIDGRFFQGMQVVSGVTGRVPPQNLSMNIRPYIDGGPGDTPKQLFRNGGTSGSLGITGANAFTTDAARGIAVAFAAGAQYRLTVKLPKDISGWFHGRLSSPDIQIQPLAGTDNLVTIQGDPVIVPMTATGWPFFSDQAVKFRADNNIKWDQAALDVFQKFEATNPQGSMTTGPGWSPNTGIDTQFKQWEKYFDPAAKAQASLWSLSTISQNQTSHHCLNKSDSLQGLITTNAMAYQGGLPTFKDGTLNYQVAGVHFDPNNQVFHGTYDLIMRSAAARCLYGFASAPISATISVIDSSGDADVAVTSFAEKDGWLTLSAHNFTFSDPTISVKLEGQALTPKPSPTDGTGGTSVKTIKCVAKAKPYKTKTVKGKAPKCPKGYVKKSK